MSDSINSNHPVDLTGPDEPAKKLPKLLTGFFRKYDPADPAQVAELCMHGAFLDV